MPVFNRISSDLFNQLSSKRVVMFRFYDFSFMIYMFFFIFAHFLFQHTLFSILIYSKGPFGIPVLCTVTYSSQEQSRKPTDLTY